MTPFVPKPEKEEINFSRESSLHEFFRLLFSAFVSIAAIVAVLSLAGEFILLHVGSPIEKYVFGSGVFLRQSHQPWPEGKIYLEKLIGAEAENFTTVIICDPSPNAMAIPGLLIGVTSGALAAIKTEQGLAMVLGHEYGHFVHKDHLRGLGLGLGLGFALSLVGLDEFGSWISDLSSTIITRRFSQSQEMAADTVATELLLKGYHSLAGASDFFEYIASRQREGVVDRMFSTHPVTQDRIAAIKAASLNHPESAKAAIPLSLKDPCVDRGNPW